MFQMWGFSIRRGFLPAMLVDGPSLRLFDLGANKRDYYENGEYSVILWSCSPCVFLFCPMSPAL